MQKIINKLNVFFTMPIGMKVILVIFVVLITIADFILWRGLWNIIRGIYHLVIS